LLRRLGVQLTLYCERTGVAKQATAERGLKASTWAAKKLREPSVGGEDPIYLRKDWSSSTTKKGRERDICGGSPNTYRRDMVGLGGKKEKKRLGGKKGR